MTNNIKAYADLACLGNCFVDGISPSVSIAKLSFMRCCFFRFL